MSKNPSQNNHYVPEWYQKGFLNKESNKLFIFDLNPDDIKKANGELVLSKGKVKKHNSIKHSPPSQCFVERDLYTTFFGEEINDEIERILFGKIDDIGAKAIQAFVGDDPSERQKNFEGFFEYIDAQKIRTPKGLHWIKAHYSSLDQRALMSEMQKVRYIHCNIWGKSVREIVSA